MKLLFSPVTTSSGEDLKYNFSEGRIEVETHTGQSDVFDFSGLPDGRLDVDNVETELDSNPLLEAEKIDGVLYVTLKLFVSWNAEKTYSFPDWIDHTEYRPEKPKKIEEEVPSSG